MIRRVVRLQRGPGDRQDRQRSRRQQCRNQDEAREPRGAACLECGETGDTARGEEQQRKQRPEAADPVEIFGVESLRHAAIGKCIEDVRLEAKQRWQAQDNDDDAEDAPRQAEGNGRPE
ncbi:MAG: hypothetical protein P8X94_02445 [Woeseiaceae bacterium]